MASTFRIIYLNLFTIFALKLLLIFVSGVDRLKWDSEDGGWGLHVTSAVSEWLIALSFNIFILTFVEEFKKFKIDSNKLIQSEEANNLYARRSSAWDGQTNTL